MRTTVLSATATAVLLMLATPSTAAPVRTVTLSDSSRSASWTTIPSAAFSSGGLTPSPARCSEPSVNCDETLINLTVPGDLKVAVKVGPGSPTGGWALGYGVALYTSSPSGARGAVIASHVTYGNPATVSMTLAPGFYLAQLSWNFGAGMLTGTATLTPA